MTGSVELDADGASLLIRFAYREDLVATVKALPGRRWDPKAKVWRVPASQVEKVYAVLAQHQFDFAPEVPSLLAGTLGASAGESAPASSRALRQAALPLPQSAAEQVATASALSVSALNARVRDGLRQQFPDAFWLVGEVIDFDKSADRTHRFFQLVEKARHQARPVAAVEVALFARTAEWLLPRLAGGNEPLALRDGIEIRALVKVDFYPATGRFQVVIQDIDPTFTLGKLALTREQILGELQQRGLAERNRSLGFPVPALRIGVLSSPDSDGWNDFARHLQEADIGFDVSLLPIKVQGTELKPSLLRGLSWFARNASHFDVLCIVRGGGSRTDLAWFDDLEIALAVASHPLKVVVGIGHQRDQSVLDAIAHSEKTPTAVAELLARGVEEARADTRERAQRLRDAVFDCLHDLHAATQRTARELHHAVERRLHSEHAALATCGRELQLRTELRIAGERATLREAAGRTRHATDRQLARRAAHLDESGTRLRLLDPARVLGRGYAIVRSTDGRVHPSVRKLTAQQDVVLQFRDGRATARVADVHRDSP
jgi:exodeoxyribonuclease VII large subunit